MNPKTYIVKRYVIEHYEVFAESREDALRDATDPYRVEIAKETAKVRKQP